MRERAIIIVGGLVGAAAGAAAAYLFLTPSGQRWRRDAEQQLTALLHEAEELLTAADQVRQSVRELKGGRSTWARSA